MSWLDTLEDIRGRDFSKAPRAEQDKVAREVVNLCSYGAAVVSVAPVPFSDAFLLLPIQATMVTTVGHVYGRKVTRAAARDLTRELGATAGAGMLARQGIKVLLPVAGALLTVPAAFALNWAIGRTAMAYFANPEVSRQTLREVFERARKEGRALFSRATFDKLRKSGATDPTPAKAAARPSTRKRPARKAPAKRRRPTR